MKGSHGPRRGTRSKLRKRRRDRGKISVTRFLQEFEVGDRVVIRPESSYHRGIPHQRFIGMSGVIKGKRGRSYLVEIRDGKKIKTLFLPPIHLKRVV